MTPQGRLFWKGSTSFVHLLTHHGQEGFSNVTVVLSIVLDYCVPNVIGISFDVVDRDCSQFDNL